MAAMTARRRYSDDRRPVEVQQTAREAPEAPPKRDSAEGKTGEATEKQFDVYSTHGGTTVVGGGASATVVVKMSNQQDIKHHGSKAKLEQPNKRAEVHRGALATATRSRRRRYRQ